MIRLLLLLPLACASVDLKYERITHPDGTIIEKCTSSRSSRFRQGEWTTTCPLADEDEVVSEGIDYPISKEFAKLGVLGLTIVGATAGAIFGVPGVGALAGALMGIARAVLGRSAPDPCGVPGALVDEDGWCRLPAS